MAALVEATSAATAACATTTSWLLPIRRLLVLLVASRGATLDIRGWWRWRWRRVAVLVGSHLEVRSLFLELFAFDGKDRCTVGFDATLLARDEALDTT